ncbi:MAG: M14 family zinc carboxypeptidase [Chloroflexota bacterium]
MKVKVRIIHVAIATLLVFVLATATALSGLAAPPSPQGPSSTVGNIPTPNEFLGIELGADRTLADYWELTNYFQEVAKRSPRVKVENIGETTLGKPMYMAIVSAPSTIQNLDKYAEIQQKLAHPEGLDPKEVDKLITEAKTVVVISAAIHSTEIAATQMVPNLLYKLASGKDDRVNEILDNVILLLIPTLNPDGHQMVTEWYKETLGTPWEGTGTPWLYHHYAGHDNNRDWYMFQLEESRNVGKQLYQKWFPEMLYDIHQMGNRGARFFVPPYTDPFNPEIDPLIIRSIMMMGGHITSDLQAKGLKGVSSNSQYDAWKSGAVRDHVYYHNIVGILTEGANAAIATPIYQEFDDLTSVPLGLDGVKTKQTAFPDPWPGGWWRMSDLMEYEETTCWSILTLAARYKDKIVRDFYDLGMRGIERGKTEPPSAYVIPPDQRDPATVAKLVDTMIFQDIQVHQALEPFTADGQSYPAGSYVVLTAQPTRANVKMLLGIQEYPDLRNPDGSPQRPYDVAGWTLWMQMGVNCIEIQNPFDAKLAVVKDVVYPEGTVSAGDASYGYAFGPEMNNAASARIQLLKDGFELKWAMEGFSTDSNTFAPGTTIVLAKEGLSDKLQTLAKELGVSFHSLASAPSVTMKDLSMPRIAVYESWRGNYDSGWMRLVLDRYGIPFEEIHDADVRAGNLGDRFDVILIADVSRSHIRNGHSAGSYPDQYCGGLGSEGVASIKAFVEGGGTLVTMNSSNEFAIKDLGVPVKNVLDGVPSSEFYCPGSLLQANADNTNPVAFGMDDVIDLYFRNSPAFEITGPEARSVISYGDTNPLRSGWICGPEKLSNRAAAVEATVGSGKAVMLGFVDHFRAQTYGTFKLLFNSIFFSTVD